MSHAIYMDAHVPSAITVGLRRRGIEVMTCQEDGSDKLSDDKLLERATQLERVLFSQDDDLLKVAAHWQATGKEFYGVIYAHQLSGGIGELIRDLELMLTCCETYEIVNRVNYLPLN
jgi:hypothetical protein